MTFKYLGLLLASGLLTALITPFLRKTALKEALKEALKCESHDFDFFEPPNPRILYQDVIPRLGGIAIAIAFLATTAFGYKLFEREIGQIGQIGQIDSVKYLVGLCLGSTLTLLVGFLDDLIGLKASQKFAGQILAVFLLLSFGFLIETLSLPFMGNVKLGPILGFLLTTFWVVGITNAFNLIDGIDGLAAGVIAIASAIFFLTSLIYGDLLMSVISIGLGARVLLTGHWADQMLFDQAYLIDLVHQLAWGKVWAHLKEFDRWHTDIDPWYFFRLRFLVDLVRHHTPDALIPWLRRLLPRRLRAKMGRTTWELPWYTEAFRKRARRSASKQTFIRGPFARHGVPSLMLPVRRFTPIFWGRCSPLPCSN